MKKTLLVRLSSMGDLIHTLPAITDLSRQRPDIELHWLCESAFADIARLHPFVKQIHELNWRQWRKQLFSKQVWQNIITLKTQLQEQHFQRVIDSQGLIKSAIAAKLANVPINGLDSTSAREFLASSLYNHTHAVSKLRDAVWRNRCLFARIYGYQIDDAPNFGISLSKKNKIKHFPIRYHVALHATSRESKLWPVGHWCTLLAKMHAIDGLPVLLPWGNNQEYTRAQTIATNLPFVHICPPLTLLEAAYLLNGADCVVGVDTGLLHLANAVGTPVIGIYTDSNPNKTGVQVSPISCNIGDIGQIPNTDQVLAAIQTCLTAAAKQLG